MQKNVQLSGEKPLYLDKGRERYFYYRKSKIFNSHSAWTNGWPWNQKIGGGDEARKAKAKKKKKV